MSIEQHIATWKWAVAGQPKGAWPDCLTTHDRQEYNGWCAALNKAQVEANRSGYVCLARGSDTKSGHKAMWITCNGETLKIQYVPSPRRQEVTETSRTAYRKIDTTTQRGRVAAFILDKTATLPDITRQEIAAWSGLGINVVCGRVNELLKEPVETAAGLMLLKIVAERKSNLPGATERNEAFRFVEWKADGEPQMRLF